MTTRSKRILLAILGSAAVSTAIVMAADRDRYHALWTDANAAFKWENELCTPIASLQGLMKSRTVKLRTEQIRNEIRLIRQEPDGLFLYHTPGGPIWMPQADDLNSLAVVIAEQEAAMYGDSSLGVRKGDVVIDAGAHVGLFAKTALAAGASKVITFEVTPASNRALRRNLAAEIADGRVVVVEKGVWFEPGVLPLTIIDGCSICNSVSHPWMGRSIDVPLTTIDLTVAELKLDRIDFIKLDIENAEANALRGAKQTIAKHQPRVAVALENSKTRIAYGQEVTGVMREAFAGYDYVCGAVTNPEATERILPEILHFSPN
jgi:FkbM family methyltransferase